MNKDKKEMILDLINYVNELDSVFTVVDIERELEKSVELNDETNTIITEVLWYMERNNMLKNFRNYFCNNKVIAIIVSELLDRELPFKFENVIEEAKNKKELEGLEFEDITFLYNIILKTLVNHNSLKHINGKYVSLLKNKLVYSGNVVYRVPINEEEKTTRSM